MNKGTVQIITKKPGRYGQKMTLPVAGEVEIPDTGIIGVSAQAAKILTLKHKITKSVDGKDTEVEELKYGWELLNPDDQEFVDAADPEKLEEAYQKHTKTIGTLTKDNERLTGLNEQLGNQNRELKLQVAGLEDSQDPEAKDKAELIGQNSELNKANGLLNKQTDQDAIKIKELEQRVQEQDAIVQEYEAFKNDAKALKPVAKVQGAAPKSSPEPPASTNGKTGEEKQPSDETKGDSDQKYTGDESEILGAKLEKPLNMMSKAELIELAETAQLPEKDWKTAKRTRTGMFTYILGVANAPEEE